MTAPSTGSVADRLVAYAEHRDLAAHLQPLLPAFAGRIVEQCGNDPPKLVFV